MSVATYTTFPAPKPLKLPRKLKIVVAIMVFAALAGLVSLVSKSKSPSASSDGPKYVGFATLVAQNYVSGHVLDVPMVAGLSSTIGRLSAVGSGAVQQDSGQSTQQQQDSTVQPLAVSNVAFYSGKDVSTGKTSVVETDKFLLEYTDGSLGSLEIVVDGTASGPELAALPSVGPNPDQASSGTAAQAPVPIANLNKPLSSGLIYQIGQWAQAYASNDGTALYVVTGDSGSQSFSGLGGWKVLGTPQEISATQDTGKDVTQIVVTVELTLQSTSNASVIEQSEYDLLVTNLLHKYPNVVAWGPPGSGSALTPYENAG